MASKKRTNFLDMERILVGKGDQALAAGNLVGQGTAFNILDGQLGVMSADHDSNTRPYGTFLEAGDTVGDACAIRLIQGTPNSCNTAYDSGWQVTHKAYVDTPIIHQSCVRSVCAMPCKVCCNSTQVVHSLPEALSHSLYSLYIKLDSVANDALYGENDDVFYVGYETPDYANVTNPIDHLLQNIVFKIDVNSRLVNVPNYTYGYGNKEMIAFGINIAGGAGQRIGDITKDTMFTYLRCGTQEFEFCPDVCFVNTLHHMIECGTVSADSTIEIVDLAQAGTEAEGIVDAFFIMGLPRQLGVAYDEVKQRQTEVEVNLGEAFLCNSPVVDCCSCYSEGTGQGRNWLIEWGHRWRMNQYTPQIFPHMSFIAEPPSYIDPAKDYTSVIIDYWDYEETLTHEQPTQKQAIILLECSVEDLMATAEAGYTVSTIDTTTVASFNAVLGGWLGSLGDCCKPKYFCESEEGTLIPEGSTEA